MADPSPPYHDLVVGNVVTHAETQVVYVVAHVYGTQAALVPRDRWGQVWHRPSHWFWIPRRMPRVEDSHG